ncbi:MAG TPA: hypothetical protein DDY77_02505, partial [Clostridiales bacterium]|nr:hypothetical protein [Clostridiales bacterium]
DMFAHAANITLNNPVTVKDGMNYVRVRFYVSYSAAESLNLRFYRSDRTNHEVETGVWFDYAADVATNGWVNVYLPVSKFAVDGQISGFKFGCFTNTGDNAEIYIDDITIVDIAGTKATLNGGTVSYPAGIPGNPFGCTDSTATTITSDSWEITGGNDYCNAMITFAAPLK